jgi:hypothetical protein
MTGMAFNIIFRIRGRFPSYRVGHNKNMKKLGITCVKHEELKCYGKKGTDSCETCGF